MNEQSYRLYIVSMIFITISLLLGDHMKSYFMDKNPSVVINIGYTVIILGLFSVIYFLFFKEQKENFFFEVSKCNPKCSGAYYGKPTTFQFTPLSSTGTECPDKNCGYGMISACDHPECQNIIQKYGGPSSNEQL